MTSKRGEGDLGEGRGWKRVIGRWQGGTDKSLNVMGGLKRVNGGEGKVAVKKEVQMNANFSKNFWWVEGL